MSGETGHRGSRGCSHAPLTASAHRVRSTRITPTMPELSPTSSVSTVIRRRSHGLRHPNAGAKGENRGGEAAAACRDRRDKFGVLGVSPRTSAQRHRRSCSITDCPPQPRGSLQGWAQGARRRRCCLLDNRTAAGSPVAERARRCPPLNQR